MKILFVLEYYLPHIGGVEIVFKNLCEGLVKRGHEVKIITSHIKGTKKKESLNGVEIERVGNGNRYLFAFLAIPKVIKEAKKYDLIHTTTFTATLPAKIASFFTSKKAIITIHEVWLNLWEKVTEKSKLSAFIHNFLEKRIYGLKFDKYVAVSNSTRKELEKIGINAVTIYNGMNYDGFKVTDKSIKKKLGLENKYVVFGYGRPGTSKGFENLIKASDEIMKKIPNSKVVLMLSTNKTYEKELNRLKKMNTDVMFIKPVKYSEVPNYVNIADVVVIPSLSEGFGYTCVEACSLGKKVVASNTTSLPEVITGKGKLVDVNVIAEGVIDVYNGNYDVFPDKKFLWKDAIDKYEELYESLK